ncbi:hypothetical protein HPB50_021035 [Hyalomma asiaticum]|uniref:Uncharacterized protein n=1 Tax=Hyalomma asiaticum TaxID=266040 RepID=A0ACB7SB60_HYAAI|nr:hypothetical protein HPB50_021035 [Hyalomma asiaticum]
MCIQSDAAARRPGIPVAVHLDLDTRLRASRSRRTGSANRSPPASPPSLGAPFFFGGQPPLLSGQRRYVGSCRIESDAAAEEESRETGSPCAGTR